MRIVELSDYSMVIMKDSEDSYRTSVGEIYRYFKELDIKMKVCKVLYSTEDSHYTYSGITQVTVSDFICSGGKLVLFFDDNIKDRFKLHDRVTICL